MILKGKIFIGGQLETLTGLHIGGSKAALEIGGVDLNVIKTPNGVPFIPGSSLKGKMRGLLAREYNSLDVREDPPAIREIFGHTDKKNPAITRFIVRDAHLDLEGFKEKFKDARMEFPFSDIKWENRIHRASGTATDPRQLERVPAGAIFHFDMVFDVYDSPDPKQLETHLDTIHLAMKLLQDDYLGGQGSRGYGQIVFKNVQVRFKTLQKGVYEWADVDKNQPIHAFSIQMNKLHEHASRTA